MKRSAALAPLSRDHHRALVIARELVRADASDAPELARRFVEFLTTHELAHFALEESVLLPAAPAGTRGRELALRVLDDHVYLRDALKRIAAADGEVDLDFLHAVGTRLRDHVGMEERELFPLLESELSAAELDELGARLAH